MAKEKILSGLEKALTVVQFVLVKVKGDSLSFFAGGIAFYSLLSVFPAMTALVSLYGLIWDAGDVQKQMVLVRDFLPEQAYDILYKQLVAIASVSSRSLSYTVAGGLVVAMLSAARGVKALMAAMNHVYRVREKRSWWYKNLVAYGFTVGGIVLMVISIILLVALPIGMRLLHLPDVVLEQVGIIRWSMLAGMVIVGLALLFRYAPARKPTKGHWLSMFVGAIISAGLWLLSSWGFTSFVDYFPQFNQVYGSLGAVVVLMIWFFLSAYAVIVGAAVNAALEDYYDI